MQREETERSRAGSRRGGARSSRTGSAHSSPKHAPRQEPLDLLVLGKQMRRTDRANSLPTSQRRTSFDSARSKKNNFEQRLQSSSSRSRETSLEDELSLDLSQVSDFEDSSSKYGRRVPLKTSTPKYDPKSFEKRRSSLSPRLSQSRKSRDSERLYGDSERLHRDSSRLHDSLDTTYKESLYQTSSNAGTFQTLAGRNKKNSRRRREDSSRKYEDSSTLHEDCCSIHGDPSRLNTDSQRTQREPSRRYEDYPTVQEDYCSMQRGPSRLNKDSQRTQRNPSRRYEDYPTVQEDYCSMQRGPSRLNEDSRRTQRDLSRPYEDFSTLHEDCCSMQGDPSRLNEQSYNMQRDPSRQYEDYATLHEDCCSVQGDPSRLNEKSYNVQRDPSRQYKDYATLHEDCCSVQGDPSRLNENSCRTQRDPSRPYEDYSMLHKDCCSMQGDSPRLIEDSSTLHEDSSTLHEDSYRTQGDLSRLYESLDTQRDSLYNNTNENTSLTFKSEADNWSVSPEYSTPSSVEASPRRGSVLCRGGVRQGLDSTADTSCCLGWNELPGSEHVDRKAEGGEWNHFWANYNNSISRVPMKTYYDQCPTPYRSEQFDITDVDLDESKKSPNNVERINQIIQKDGLYLTPRETQSIIKCAHILGNVLSKAIDRKAKDDDRVVEVVEKEKKDQETGGEKTVTKENIDKMKGNESDKDVRVNGNYANVKLNRNIDTNMDKKEKEQTEDMEKEQRTLERKNLKLELREQNQPLMKEEKKCEMKMTQTDISLPNTKSAPRIFEKILRQLSKTSLETQSSKDEPDQEKKPEETSKQ